MLNKLPKEKRDRIILMALGTLVVMVGLWFSLIASQSKRLQITVQQIVDEQDRVTKAEGLVKSGPKVQEELDNLNEELRSKEESMASGDLFSWFYNRLNNFRANFRVEIVDIKDQQLGEVKLLPNFPYKAVTFTVNMVGYYHELGKFLADFENHFPYMRVQNILIKQAESTTPEEMEKLSCKMDIVLLRRQPTTTP